MLIKIPLIVNKNMIRVVSKIRIASGSDQIFNSYIIPLAEITGIGAVIDPEVNSL